MNSPRSVVKTVLAGVPVLFGLAILVTAMHLFVEEPFIATYTILPALLLYGALALAGTYIFGKVVLDIR